MGHRTGVTPGRGVRGGPQGRLAFGKSTNSPTTEQKGVERGTSARCPWGWEAAEAPRGLFLCVGDRGSKVPH